MFGQNLVDRHGRSLGLTAPDFADALRMLGDEPAERAGGCAQVAILVDQQVGHSVPGDGPSDRVGRCVGFSLPFRRGNLQRLTAGGQEHFPGMPRQDRAGPVTVPGKPRAGSVKGAIPGIPGTCSARDEGVAGIGKRDDQDQYRGEERNPSIRDAQTEGSFPPSHQTGHPLDGSDQKTGNQWDEEPPRFRVGPDQEQCQGHHGNQASQPPARAPHRDEPARDHHA